MGAERENGGRSHSTAEEMANGFEGEFVCESERGARENVKGMRVFFCFYIRSKILNTRFFKFFKKFLVNIPQWFFPKIIVVAKTVVVGHDTTMVFPKNHHGMLTGNF